ncbi:PREDICTED: uncharacterized protein LOC104806201 [Tarenaya hassleriana]|uniref:uncharacterized protein LOC104806201 n=1 Tax=Tarenaya hassleriana TaxID=28532 RepID=UPI00053C83BF|nr:PREDICTED: uncharacterized protein LOC104806201 [Tarenaya hassleriana]
MTPCRTLTSRINALPSPSRLLLRGTRDFVPMGETRLKSTSGGLDFPAIANSAGDSRVHAPLSSRVSSAAVTSKSPSSVEAIEEVIEKVIYRCRFMAFLGTLGSLVGSVICFIKGCTYVAESFAEFFVNRGKIMMLLVEAIDIYLLGTVMLVFGMGLYELFISNLDTSKLLSDERAPNRSNLFGLFTLKERPRWLDIKSVSELKTKLGHVIVMLLLIGWFDKSKKAVITSVTDLLCFSASIFLSSLCLFLLSRLNGSD